MDKVLEYGIKIIEENPSIRDSRKIFNFDTNNPIETIIKDLGLEYEYTVVERESGIGFEMGWHQDDVAFHRNSKAHCEKYGKDPIKPYCKGKQPIYTLILYYSTQGEDFEGGEFCFVDMKINPKKGKGIFFDSREIHKVQKIRVGERKAKIIKFYQ